MIGFRILIDWSKYSTFPSWSIAPQNYRLNEKTYWFNISVCSLHAHKSTSILNAPKLTRTKTAYTLTHTHTHTQHIETKPKQLICNMCIIFQWILPSSCLGIGLCAKFSIKQCSLAKALFFTIGFCQPTTDIIEVHDFEYHPMKELDPPKLGKPTMF